MHQIPWRILPLALMALAPEPSLADTAAKPTTVTLTYAHNDDEVAQVELRMRETRTDPWPTESITRRSYQSYIEPVADGFVTRSRNWRSWAELPGQPGRIDEQGTAFVNLFDQITQRMEMVIGRDGSLVRIAGLSTATAQMRALFQQLAYRLPPSRRIMFEDFIESEINEEQLMAAAMTLWHQTTGVWNGMTLEKGRVLESEDTTPSPMLGAAPIPVKHRIKFVDWVPCDGHDKSQNCVSLEMRTVMNAEKRQATLRDFSRRMSKNRGANVVFESLDHEVLVKLVVEPRTLRGYRCDINTAMALVLSDADGTFASSQTRQVGLVIAYLTNQ